MFRYHYSIIVSLIFPIFCSIHRMADDGRITEVQVYGIQKRYTPEKHYVFILKVQRASSKIPEYIFRTYKEFCELDSKLCNSHRQARNHR